MLGPFVFFFTLSCADKRWKETYAAILAQKGHNITYSDDTTDGGTFQEGTTYVGNMTLDEALANENTHQLIKEDVLTITRVFDNRLKMFERHIMTHQNQPMKVQYTYIIFPLISYI